MIADVVRYSSVDWPGKLVATIFVQGCPWRCDYCYNVDMQWFEKPDSACTSDTHDETVSAADWTWDAVLEFLKTRAGLLDGVVFTGGEPLTEPALPIWAQDCRDLGFLVGLHTSGALPEALETVLPLIDWVGLDIKAPAQTYDTITRIEGSGVAAYRSLALLIESRVQLEIRTTADTRILTLEAFAEMHTQLNAAGATQWMVQPCYSSPVRQPLPLPNLSNLTGLPNICIRKQSA